MATKNIYNKLTGQSGYQVPGATLSPGWQWGEVQRYPVSTPASTPTAPATTTPVSRYSTNRVTGSLEQATSALTDVSSEERQREIQRQADEYAAQRRQARIDAINQTFAPRIARETEEGKARLARVAAINFKSGIVGSGADTTRTGEQTKLNEDALRAIEDEKATLINDAFEAADALAVERAQLLTAQAEKGATAQVEKYKALADKALATLKSFGTAGKTLDDIKYADPDTYNTLKNVSGLSDFEIDNLMNAASKQTEILKTEVTSDGTVVNVIRKADGSIEVKRYATDLQGGEEFKTVDGVAYGVKKDANGNLVARKLTEKNYASDNKPFFELDNKTKAALLGAGLSTSDIQYLKSGVEEYGLETVLRSEKFTPAQEKAVRDAFGGASTSISMAQLKTAARSAKQEDVESFLRATYTPDQLYALSYKSGMASPFKKNTTGDIDSFLSSPAARDAYANLLKEQYESSGYTVK